MTSKSSISSEGCLILPCEMQHTYTCYDQRPFCHVSLNVISHYFLEHSNETSFSVKMYKPTTQCVSKTY